MEALFLGIDTGTQGVRVAVCDAKGKICSSCEKKWDTSYPHLGWVEQSPMHWWESILEAMEECCRGLTAEQKQSIISGAVCATSSTTIPVKDDGTPLMPAIMWMDARSKEEMKAINATGHPMLQHCGGAVSCEWLVPKTLWIKRHDPEVYAQTDH
nr:carbohydrate kinase [Eubacterium sp.]